MRWGRKLASVALAAALAIGSTTTAYAWSRETHQTTGAIAWADLSAHRPDVLAELLAISRAHQHIARLDRHTAALPEPVRQRALFEWLARWPDDIRTGPEDRPKWHYSLRVVYGRTWLWPVRNGEAKDGFATNFATLSDSCAPPVDRARAIGWLIHIVGDIQQPLHAGHQMTGLFPATDRAGQESFVRRFADSAPVSLHQYWDHLFEEGRVTTPGGDWASALARTWPRSTLPELNGDGTPHDRFARYLDESEALAGLVGYSGTYLDAKPAGQAAPVISARENRVAYHLAGRRVASGGYRIADVLAAALDQAKAGGGTCRR